MPKKKEPDLTAEEQFKRFQEAAKEHGIEKQIPEIERSFKKMFRSHRHHASAHSDEQKKP